MSNESNTVEDRAREFWLPFEVEKKYAEPIARALTDFAVQETEALATRIRELEGMVDAAKEIGFGEKGFYLEHKPNGLGWRAYHGSVNLGGVSVGDHFPTALEAFKSLQAQKEEK